jgi:DnaD/phage-associated family protein
VARPLKEGMDYFPHDTDASNDEKIEALRALYGNDGYAFYFILLERIYRTVNAELDVSKPAVLAALINKVGVNAEKFHQILETAFDLECFDRDRYQKSQALTSRGIKKRASEVHEMRERWRKRKDKQVENSEEIEEDNPEETPESKVKESKENKKDDQKEEKADPVPELVKKFEGEFGRLLSPMELAKIEDWAKNDHHPQVLILEALKRATLRGILNFKYIDSILADWKKNNVKTIQEAEAREQQFYERVVKNKNKHGPGVKDKPVKDKYEDVYLS